MYLSLKNYYNMVRDKELFITGGAGLKDASGEFWYNGTERQFRTDCGGMGETCITAYSYDIAKRVETVYVMGGDNRQHPVPVEWDEYLPLQNSRNFFIGTTAAAQRQNVLAQRKDLCIFKS